MELFLQLYLGHLLGDFLLQPGRLVVAKRDGIPGLILHTLIVGAATIAVLIGTLRFDWAPAVLVTGLHLVIERITITTYLHTRTRGLFTFVMDQALHMLSIALIVWVAGRWTTVGTGTVFGISMPTVDLAMLCALLTVMLLGSIFVFETVNAVLGVEKGRLLRLDAARMGGIVERGSAFAVALIHPALVALPFLPRLILAFTGEREARDRRLVEAAAGLLMCIVGWASVAAIAYLHDGSLDGLRILTVGLR